MIYSEPWQLIDDWLAATLTAATATGGPLAGYYVEHVAPPASQEAQTLGFQFRRSSDEPIGQNRRRQTAVFDFMMVVARGFDNVNTDAANQAKLQVETAWNDRAGRGLGPVLLADPTLGGNCTFSRVSMSISVGRSITDETDTSAIVLVNLTTTTDAPVFY